MRWLFTILDISLTALLFVALLCALTQPAYAYVDPGSGLFAFQIATSTIAGMIFMLRKHLRTFLLRVTMRSESKREKATEE